MYGSKLCPDIFLPKFRNIRHICLRCLNSFQTSESLAKHELDCALQKTVCVVMPTEDNKFLKFKNFNHQERCLVSVYTDFEALLVPITRCGGDPDASHTSLTQKHVPYAVAYQVVHLYDSTKNELKSHVGKIPVDWLLSELEQLCWEVDKLYRQNVPMIMTQDDEESYKTAVDCLICTMPLNREAETPRKDHCHIMRKYRGAAHNSCNLNYQAPRHIPVFMHNLSAYNAYIVIEPLAKFGWGDAPISIIPDNTEKYISFSKRMTPKITLRFLDSLRFMQASLQKLVETLPQSEMHITRAASPDETEFQLLTRKGVFLYEYLDSMEKLKETGLPDISAFTSTLTGDTVSESEYIHACNVWRAFNIPNLSEYAHLYMETDVRLLAYVFDKFRDVCMATYSLDPAFYYTAPGLSWDAMLRKMRVNIELLTDVDMLLFFERGIRGGLYQCIHRHAKANNPQMGEVFNASEATSYIMYLDVNNLNRYAIQQSLPIGRFRWLSDKECLRLGENLRNNRRVVADAGVGYVLEVELEYPLNLHDEHSDLPLCPEQRVPRGGSTPKLLTTLEGKQRYIINYQNLQQCLD